MMPSEKPGNRTFTPTVRVEGDESYRPNPLIAITPEAQKRVTELVQLNEQLIERLREQLTEQAILEFIKILPTVAGLLTKSKGGGLLATGVGQRLAGLDAPGYGSTERIQMKSIVKNLRSSEFAEQVVRDFQRRLFPKEEEIKKIRENLSEQERVLQEDKGYSREEAENSVALARENREMVQELNKLEPEVRLLRNTLLALQERWDEVKVFEKLCEERLRKELGESHGTSDTGKVIEQNEEFQKFYESGETAVGNLDRQVERFVADSRQSFGTFQEVVQRVLANVEGLFGKSVGSIVSKWFSAIQQMVMGAKTGGQGILQGILGGLFGVFPGGPIGTPPFVPAVPSRPGFPFPDFFGAVPLSAGRSGSAEIPAARGGAAEQVQRALQTLIFGGSSRLAALRSLGLAGADIGGNFLLEIARRAGGPVKGALGGALVGLSTGAALAGGFGAAFAGLLATGPVGLAVGAVTGLILGIIGRGRAKNQAARMEEEVIREGQKIAEQFRRFEIEYEPARAQLEALQAQGVETLLGSRLGRAGRRGAENLARNLDVQIRALENLQRQREQRLGIVQGFALPEFQSGGVVSTMRSMRAITSARGGILAMLHPGEFVLRKEAVEAVGATLLARINRSPHATPADLSGGGLQPVQVNLSINALDGADAARFWKQNSGQVIRIIRRAVQDRAL